MNHWIRNISPQIENIFAAYGIAHEFRNAVPSPATVYLFTRELVFQHMLTVAIVLAGSYVTREAKATPKIMSTAIDSSEAQQFVLAAFMAQTRSRDLNIHNFLFVINWKAFLVVRMKKRLSYVWYFILSFRFPQRWFRIWCSLGSLRHFMIIEFELFLIIQFIIFKYDVEVIRINSSKKYFVVIVFLIFRSSIYLFFIPPFLDCLHHCLLHNLFLFIEITFWIIINFNWYLSILIE